ncbi:putative iron-regulated membrane protein [Sphingomonas naasensis]|uniref:PepSY-associated TM helix domain-containing protein n=1 Tax=Sphingomonas naasensis TaxID=1344951 RepID=UPI001F0DF714|nr:PepSY domain-containing protein [Sphingomonas naasensis]NIJ20660.1 putative iron-regulated membrane protein [Sphingomonas naasensis]
MSERPIAAGAHAGALYRTIWRWHFYAGLFVLPFILILSVTGSIYLFKPQIDRWQERAYRGLGTEGAVSPDKQLASVMTRFPTARFTHYRLPEQPGDAAMVQLGFTDGQKRDVYVSPQGQVLGDIDPETRISDTVSRIHGSLLLGTLGDRLVELAASWTIVMLLTGLYLWWPRPFRAGGTIYPRLSLKGRPLLKDIHRVTGFWIAGLVLVMLASGLPWAGAWGGAFKWARTELGLVKGPQDWKIGADGGHAGHHGAPPIAMPMPDAPEPGGLPLSTFVARAEGEHMAFPVLVLPPHAPQRFGPPLGNEWMAKSEAQNRWLGRQVTYDPTTGHETGRRGFADQHIVDRIVNTGVAWHEGQLFGLANQLIGVVTAFSLIAISILGVVMWLKRRPRDQFGAPPRVRGARLHWVISAMVLLAVLLPLFGASLLALILLDRSLTTARRVLRA